MKKNNRVKKQHDFQNVITKGKKYSNQYFVLYVITNNINEVRFGISVGKKLGNAVFRNKMKRQLREIITSNLINIKKNNDYIIILRGKGTKIGYNDKEENLRKLLIQNNFYVFINEE